MTKCKRCLVKNEVTDEVIEKMVDEVRAMKGVRLVSEAEFERRYSICRECEKLEYGSTCMLCGCVVQVRARLENGKCPYPKHGKW